jgi:hypothetical protein
MSEIMLLGVLRAPHDPDNFLAMVQLIARAREAADRIEELELALREAVEEFREMDEPMVAERYRAVLKKKS